MFVIIVGAGKTGAYLARDMAGAGHRVTVLDKNRDAVKALEAAENLTALVADGCDPQKLEAASAPKADAVVAVTGDDEDNLVVSWLAKYVFNVKRVIAKANNPRNSWLFGADWGVDAPVSSAGVISKLIEEEASLGNLVTLLKLERGELALIELMTADGSKLSGERVNSVELPEGVVLVALIRDGRARPLEPGTMFVPGDRILALAPPAVEERLASLFAAGL